VAKLAECPVCHQKQGVKNKKCRCGCDLSAAKKNKKVRYWDDYRVNGKQVRQFIGMSIEEAHFNSAQNAIAKAQGHDPADDNTTVSDIVKWYTGLTAVNRLKTYRDVKRTVEKFAKSYGHKKTSTLKKNLLLKKSDIEDYQTKLETDGLSNATIDTEIRIVKTMFNRADGDDMINPNVMKAFKNLNKRLIIGANARERVITIPEFIGILENSPPKFKNILIVAMNTGMRAGEISKLEWSHYDKYAGVFRLPPSICKEKRSKDKIIPVSESVKKILKDVVRCAHHNFIFTNSDNEPFKNNTWQTKVMKGACRRAEVPYGRAEERGVTFHDIRRSVKTYMLEVGVDKTYRDIILGH
jgi:integrase